MTDSYRDTHQSVQSWRSIPVEGDNILSMPSRDTTRPEPTPQNIQTGLLIVVTANLAVMVIVIGGMLWGGAEPVKSIVSGVVYFTLTSPFYLAIVTGVLTAVVGRHEAEVTERYRIQAYTQVAGQTIGWRLRVEENHALELQAHGLPADLPRRLAQLEDRLFAQQLSAEGVQTPTATSSFVAPYDNRSTAAFAQETQPAIDTTASEALAWVRGLYLDTGLPDPAQVQTSGDKTGWLKVRMLGSKRGTGSKEAGLWLLHRKVILRAAGGYRLNVELFPRRESLRALL